MTPQQRANHIIDYVEYNSFDDPKGTSVWVADQIQKAIDEAFSKNCEVCYELGHKAGRSQVLEQAVKVVKENTLNALAQNEPAEKWLANLISSLLG